MQSIKNINFNKLQEQANKLKFGDNDLSNSYLRTYPAFLGYFSNLKGEITEYDLIISSHFVYGWMPTIVNLRLEHKAQVLRLFNQARTDCILKKSELSVLKEAINNSMVGLSKLLHFINPDIYAIWDSRIYFSLTDYKSTSGIGRVDLYLEYLQELERIRNTEGFVGFNHKIAQAVGYPISPNRAIELVLFETDKIQSKPNKK